METAEADLFALVQQMREQNRRELAGRIITVASDKGGIGKTTLAVELAYLLGAVLVDADWHDGCASRSLGWRHWERVRSPLLDAMEAGRVPRPISGGPSRPDLVAAGPDLEHRQPQPAVMADALVAWATAWNLPVVVDTHPGGGDAANGATAAAHLVPTPAPLRQKDLDALAGWVRLMDGYPLMIVPNMVPRVPPAAQLDYLASIADKYDLPVATPVPHATFLERRLARTAVCSVRQLSVRTEPLVRACIAVAEEVAKRVA
jgi:chromosome partitioning protein